MKRMMFLCLLALLTACGDDEVPAAAVDRCSADGYAVYAEGNILTDVGVFKINTALKDAMGSIKGQEFQIQLGNLARDTDAPPLLFKIRENTLDNSLLDNFANGAEDGPLTLNLVDASSPPTNAARRTDLSTFDCSIQDGTTCGQLAVDTADANVISDADDKVYNFTSGTFTVVEVQNLTSRLLMQFNVKLGPNVLESDDMSSGEIQGCFDVEYTSQGANGTSLR